MQNTALVSPITFFHRILACFWVFGMVFLSFGIINAQTATDRQNRSEVGLMTKPLEAASRWLINKQIKAAFGDIEAQAIIVDDVINNALQAAKYIWEKAWQTAILQAALKLISAIFKIISDFVNKLMDMISSIGNLNAVLAPFASSIVGVARSAYSKVVACANYWARRELQEVLPNIDTGGKARECPWLDEEPKSTETLQLGFTTADTADKIDQVLNTGIANIAANRNTIPTAKVEAFIQAGADAKATFSFSKTTNIAGCTTGNWLFDQISGVACLAEYEKARDKQFKKDQEADTFINEITDTQNKIEGAIAGEPHLNGNLNGDNLAIVGKSEIKELEEGSKNKTKVATLPDWWNPKSLKGQKDLSIIAFPKVNWLDKYLDVIALQSTQKPQPAGGIDEMFSSLTEQFTKMLNDLITNLVESVIFKIVDFIADNLLKAINSFLGPDSILGGLGLDSVAGNLVNTMRDGIKDSVSNIGKTISSAAKSISDPLASSGKYTSEVVANFNCDDYVYWKGEANYDLAKQKNCPKIVDSRFDNSWCKTYTDKAEYDRIHTAIGYDEAITYIQKTCKQRGLGAFEYKS